MDNLFISIIGGVIVFSISQYFQKFILEPVLEYRKTLSDISQILLLNQGTILNGGPSHGESTYSPDQERLKNNIHALSARLRTYSKVIPFYDFSQKLRIFGLPTKKDLLGACHSLNAIGYSVYGVGPHEKRIKYCSRG